MSPKYINILGFVNFIFDLSNKIIENTRNPQIIKSDCTNLNRLKQYKQNIKVDKNTLNLIIESLRRNFGNRFPIKTPNRN